MWSPGTFEPNCTQRAGLAGLLIGHRAPAVAHLHLAVDLSMSTEDVLGAARSRLILNTTGGGADPLSRVTEARAIVDLTADDPDSREHVEARVALAERLMWAGEHGAALEEAERVMAAVGQSASAAVMSLAHQAMVLALVDTPGAGEWHAEESMRWALIADDPRPHHRRVHHPRVLL